MVSFNSYVYELGSGLDFRVTIRVWFRVTVCIFVKINVYVL